MSYTKGEWKITNKPIFDYISIDTDERRIAKLYHHYGDNYANAQLISAAPDLLKACKYALDKYDDKFSWSKMALILIEAINKAEGKEE